MNDELRRIINEIAMSKSRKYLGIYPEGLKILVETLVDIAVFPEKIRTKKLSNTNYRYTCPFVQISVSLNELFACFFQYFSLHSACFVVTSVIRHSIASKLIDHDMEDQKVSA
jgi:hypothetical protein